MIKCSKMTYSILLTPHNFQNFKFVYKICSDNQKQSEKP